MNEPRLLVFAINYRPEPTGPALNTAGLAEGLAARGWSVEVVTGRPHYPAWRPSPAPRSERIANVYVRRYSHYVPETQTALRRGLYELSWYLSGARSVVSARRPDLILGVSPSVSGAALAWTAAVRFRTPFCLMFQDLAGRAAVQSGIKGGRAVARIVSAAEQQFARHAALTFVVAEGFADYFTAAGVPAARVIRVRNPSRLRSPTRPREETRARLGWQPGDFVVLHSGSIGLKQGLDLAIRASEILGRDSGVRLVLQGDGNERKHLERLAASVPSSSVEFRPLAPADEYAEVLVAADALLLSQRATVRNMALPAKLGSYFASGRPVIAAVHADDEVAREVRAAGAGLIVVPEDPHALVAAIETLRGDRSSAAAFGKAGRSYAERVLSEVTTLRALDEALRAVITRQTTYPAAGPA